MISQHSAGIPHALYGVFVLPALSRPSGRLTTFPVRCFSTKSPLLAVTRPPEIRAQKWNDEITSRRILLIDTETDKPLKSIQLRYQVLARLNTKTQRLVQVDSQIQPDGEEIAVCKLWDKKEQFQRDQKFKTENKESRRLSAVAASEKTLEINWAIDLNDLGHRMTKMRKFLSDGRKVHVVLAGKRKGRKATVEECQDILKRIRDTALEVKGAREWKIMEGKLGGLCKLYFRGTVSEEERQDPAPAEGNG